MGQGREPKGAPVDPLTADVAWDRLGWITQLLHQAATQVWNDADEAATDSPLHDLGLGVYLAHSQASALLPNDYELSEDIEPLADLDNRTPLQLLAEAEALTRPLALHQPEPAHGSQLVLDLCDLIREARRNGY